MKCPVCQTVNADNAGLCQQCHSDLEIYRQLDNIDSNLSNKKRAVILLSTLIGFLVLGGSAAFIQLNEAPNLMFQEQTEAMAVIEKQNRELRSLLVERTTEMDKLSMELKDALAREADYANLEDVPGTELEQEAVSGIRKPKQKPIRKPLDPNIRVHEFLEGETLWSLARQECGSGQYYARIMKDNDITDPTQVKVGTKLKIYCE